MNYTPVTFQVKPLVIQVLTDIYNHIKNHIGNIDYSTKKDFPDLDIFIYYCQACFIIHQKWKSPSNFFEQQLLIFHRFLRAPLPLAAIEAFYTYFPSYIGSSPVLYIPKYPNTLTQFSNSNTYKYLDKADTTIAVFSELNKKNIYLMAHFQSTLYF